MYQANPDLSPFDIRNIMQETSTYRECHYMLANEPQPKTRFLKSPEQCIRSWDVTAQPAVDEAANYDYDLSLTLNVTLPVITASIIEFGLVRENLSLTI